MRRLTSFPPIIGEGCSTLILGSMPSARSLQMEQYYAHPQNRFWPIMFRVFEQPFSADYAARKALLLDRAVGLWDVLGECEREGSLDSAIRNAKTNDFDVLFREHPGISRIFLNGSAAASVFTRAAIPPEGARIVRLPSTSPANRSISGPALYAAWEEVARE